jgi:endonuclease YncB( thermonuclease family)
LIFQRKHILISAVVLFSLLSVFLAKWHWNQRARGEQGRPHGLVRIDKSAIRFDDGDTFFYKQLTIRLLGIDCPEIVHKEHGIYEDQPYGPRAAVFTADMLRKATRVEYLPFQNDKYGRLLAHVFVNGELLSVLLIKAGLAYETVSYYGNNGFPELAERILRAARESPRPPFERPNRWRRKHQIRQ